MNNARKKAVWPIVAALTGLIVLATLGLYVWGYFAMGETFHVETHRDHFVSRVYSEKWQAQLFRPASKIDSLVTGEEVRTFSFDKAEDDAPPPW